MGSQAIYSGFNDAPGAIVVKVRGGWRIAQKVSATQPDNYGGGRGPVVISYELAPGLPYRSEAAAGVDAALILQRG